MCGGVVPVRLRPAAGAAPAALAVEPDQPFLLNNATGAAAPGFVRDGTAAGGMAHMENLGDLFRRHVGTGKLAAIDLLDPADPREVGYDELDRRCDAVARGLERAGLGPGDRVALLALNRTEYLEVVFGALRAGCVPVPVNVRQGAETVGHVIRDAGTRRVFTEAAWRDLVPDGPAVTELDDRGADGYEAFLDFGPFESVAVGPETVSMQMYTSGTTGKPKGVLLTHAGQGWASRAITAARRLDDTDRVLMSAPFFHKNALVAIKTCLWPGSPFVVLPRFDARACIRAIEDHRCTMTTGVPTMLHMMLAERELLDRTDVSSVRIVSMGSAPASRAVIRPIRRTRSPAAARLSATASAVAGSTITAMPIPQLKVRSISRCSTPPAAASQAKTGGRGQGSSIWAARPSGRTRGRFSVSPPPVIWAKAFTPPSPPTPIAARQGFT